MGQPELAAALRRSGEERAREIWAEVERQAAVEAEEAEVRLQTLRLAARRRRRTLLSERLAAEQLVAGERLRLSRAELYRELDEQARQLAGERLAALVAGRPRAGLFAAFAAELPQCAWEEIRVAAADAPTARTLYPAARVQVDDQVTDGVLALAAGGRIEIDNRLETRLRRAWPELLTRLWQQLQAEAGGGDAAA